MAVSYFDEIFFSHFIKQEGDEVIDICHRHIITILDTIIIGIFFWAILPTFFYYNDTVHLKSNVPFIFFEIYLFFTYLILIYKIFDWYNDVWIITDKGIIDLDWQFMKTNIVYIDYNDVKGIGVKQKTSWDGLLNKGIIEIHTMGGEGAGFMLEDAKNPGEITGFIQSILEEREKKKKDKDVSLTDRLFNTLRGVIKEHLEKEGIEEAIEEEETEENVAISKALKHEGTIDLRHNKE